MLEGQVSKKIGLVMMIIAMVASVIVVAGCSKTSSDSTGATSGAIDVVSRESGSGTRGAFIELFGVEQKDASGNKVDMTTDEAAVSNSTEVMMSTVAGDPYAIGYISLGSLNDTVKALQVDGVDPTAANIKNGSYKIARPFNIATKGNVSTTAQDFINYIMSSDGQKIIEDNGYIAINDSATAYTSSNASGTVTVAGSSSVTPVMEKLAEAYMAINPSVKVEINESDSTTGMQSVDQGICDIGMASRDLKDSEKADGITPTVIAMDGIAIVVNNDSSLTNITSSDVCGIYTGQITDWSEVAA